MILGCMQCKESEVRCSRWTHRQDMQACQDDLSVAGAHVVSDKWAGLGGVLLTAAWDLALVYKRMQHSLHLPCLE